MTEQKLSRTAEELQAVVGEGTQAKKVLKFLFLHNTHLSAGEMVAHVEMDARTIQSAINYSILHKHAEIESLRNGRTSSYLLIKIYPENIVNAVKYEYTSENGTTFRGMPSIARHLKVSKESIIYQVHTMGKSLDEAIAYLKTIGAIQKKDECGMVFVNKAMNCPEPPQWCGALTPQARV